MGKLYSMMRQGEVAPDTPEAVAAEDANRMGDPQKMMAGEMPAFSMPATFSQNFGAAIVSPAQFAKLAGVGHNLVRAWCHLPGFPVHREGGAVSYQCGNGPGLAAGPGRSEGRNGRPAARTSSMTHELFV
ncbi:MAG: hypothetical protein AB9917_13480 [Negativicutes bacterium]